MRYAELIEEFRRAPFVRLLLPFLLGIVWQMQVFPSHIAVFPIALSIFVVYIVLHIAVKSYVRRWIHGIPMSLFLFLCGITASQNVRQHSDLPQNTPIKILAVVADEPNEGVKFTKYTLIATAWMDSLGNVNVADEKMFIYLRHQDSTAMPQLGDELFFNAVVQKIPPPQNPYEFDYADYLRKKQIFCSAFVDAEQCLVTGKDRLPLFTAFCKKIRRSSVQILEQSGIDGEELGVLQTLTLGDRSRLDSDLRNAFASAGASHVLAVSGAHVMMIAMILNFLFKPITRRKYGNVIGGAIILLILWTYALITGLAPPVLRATLMFSMMTVGGMLNRKGNTYNNLAFAAFLICLFDPNALYDVGFQLSFIAVMSIAFFHPRIYKLIYVKNKIVDSTWGAFAIAVSANIGTFPIVILTFHQFPLYFILTNVLITLPVTLILIFFVVVFVFSLIPLVNMAVPLFAFCLKYCVKTLNYIIRWVEGIPGSLADGLWFNTYQAWALLVGILLLSLYLWTRQRKLIIGALCSVVAFFALQAQTLYARQQQCLLAVYNIRNTSLLHFFNAEKPFVICDSADLRESFDFQLKSYMASLGLNSLNDIPKIPLQDLPFINDDGYNIYHSHIGYFGKTIAIAGQQYYANPHHPLRVDYLIITSQCTQTPEQIFTAYAPQQVILDASLNRATHRRFTNYMIRNNLPFHSVQQDNAFVCDLNEQ
ncbi:competence protein [Bacteroidia bacterium]|nr:competence protein [Bacteroidia bacterium]